MSRKTRRKSGKPRHPNGRIVATGPAVERDTKEVAEGARMRHHGLSKVDAGKQEASTAIGRLLITGQIDKAQYDAAEHFLRVVQAYQRAIGSPAPLGSAGDLERGGGYDAREGDECDYVERCRRDRLAFRMARRELLEAGDLVFMAVNWWVVEGVESWRTLGELRIGLNALRKLFRVHEQRAA